MCTRICDSIVRPGFIPQCVHNPGPLSVSTQVCVSMYTPIQCTPTYGPWDFAHLYPSDPHHPCIYPKLLWACSLPCLASLLPGINLPAMLPLRYDRKPASLAHLQLSVLPLRLQRFCRHFKLLPLMFLLMAPRRGLLGLPALPGVRPALRASVEW